MTSLVESGKVSGPLLVAEATQFPSNQVCVVTQALQFCLFIIYTVYVSSLCERLAISTYIKSCFLVLGLCSKVHSQSSEASFSSFARVSGTMFTYSL